MGTPTLSALTERDRADFVDVTSGAFAADPWYVALFGAHSPDSERRRREFFAFLFDLSLWTGSEVRGLRHAGRLVGAYILDVPAVRVGAWPRVVARALTKPIGLSWRNARLIAAYLQHTRAVLPRGRTHYLALIGVDAGLRGQGYGRIMLDDILARFDDDPLALGMRWLMKHVEAEHDDTLVVTLEDGAVGASMLIAGRPNRGCVLGGNELGHMSLNIETARCYCGGVGCVERVFCTDFLHRLGGRGSLGEAFAEPALSAPARQIIDLVALGVANATVFARPHRVVVAGMPAHNARFRDALERAWRRRLPAVFRERVTLSWYETKATLSAETSGWLAIASVLSGSDGRAWT